MEITQCKSCPDFLIVETDLGPSAVCKKEDNKLLESPLGSKRIQIPEWCPYLHHNQVKNFVKHRRSKEGVVYA